MQTREQGKAESAIDQIIESAYASYQFLLKDPQNYQAVIKAIFQLNLEKRCIKPAFLSASSQRNDMADILNRAIKEGDLREETDTHLIAEQMNIVSVMLMENWSAQLISLDYYRYSCELNFLMMLIAWSTDQSSQKLSEKLMKAQNALAKVSDVQARKNAS